MPQEMRHRMTAIIQTGRSPGIQEEISNDIYSTATAVYI